MPDLLKSLYRRALSSVIRDEGQALTEYALIIALMALVSILALTLLGGGVTSVLTTVGRAA